jgi:hypothetical protein
MARNIPIAIGTKEIINDKPKIPMLHPFYFEFEILIHLFGPWNFEIFQK